MKEVKDIINSIGTKQDWTLSPSALREWGLRVQDTLDCLGKIPEELQLVTILRRTLPTSTDRRLRALGQEGPQTLRALFQWLDGLVEGMKNMDMDRHEAMISAAKQGGRTHAEWVSYIDQLQAVDISMGITRMTDFWTRILLNRLSIRGDIQMGISKSLGHLDDYNYVRQVVLQLDVGVRASHPLQHRDGVRKYQANSLEEPGQAMESSDDRDSVSDTDNDQEDDSDGATDSEGLEANFVRDGKFKKGTFKKKGSDGKFQKGSKPKKGKPGTSVSTSKVSSHFGKDSVRDKLVQADRAAGQCFICHKSGHFAKECPDKSKIRKDGGKKYKAFTKDRFAAMMSKLTDNLEEEGVTEVLADLEVAVSDLTLE